MADIKLKSGRKIIIKGGSESLQVEINVRGKACGGCRYHTFPYKCQSPVSINGKRPNITVRSKEDVLNIIDSLILEIEEQNKDGHDFDINSSVIAQLPFFACQNIFIDSDIQKDIKRYIYCTEIGVSPYEGHMGKHPYKWVDRFFLIKRSLANLEKSEIQKRKNKK